MCIPEQTRTPDRRRRTRFRVPAVAYSLLAGSCKKGGPAMSQQNVASLVGRLLTDPELRSQFALDPVGTIAELHMLGFLLSPAEIDAFVQTDVRRWCREDHTFLDRVH
jgi:hypothetical protein